MARLTFQGVNDVMLAVDQMDKGLAGRIDKALELSGAVMQEEMRAQTRLSFKEPTGELATTVRPGMIIHQPGGAWIDVWAQGSYIGKRGSERRAETVGFVLEYGRTGMDATLWHRKARNRSKPRINSIMEEVLGT